MKTNWLIITSLLSLFLTGCISSPFNVKDGKLPLICFSGCKTISVVRERPPKVNLYEYDSVALGNFSGEYSGTIKEAIRNAILQGDTLKLASNIDVDDDDIKIAVISGKTTKAEFNQSHHEGKGKCYEGLNFKARDCWINKTIADWRLSFLIEVEDASTGETIIRESFSDSKSETANGRVKFDKGKGLSVLVSGVSNQITPYFSSYNFEAKAKIFTDEDFPHFAEGDKYMSAKKWNDAIIEYEKAVKRAEQLGELPYRAMSYYNLGIALGYSDIDHPKSMEYIAKAKQLVEDKDYDREIVKIKKYMEDYNTLKLYTDKK